MRKRNKQIQKILTPLLLVLLVLTVILLEGSAEKVSREYILSNNTDQKKELERNIEGEQTAQKYTTDSQLSLERILDKNNFFSKNDEKDTFTILVTGDVNLGRRIDAEFDKRKSDKYPFEHIADILQSADVTIVNLESLLFDNCPLISHPAKICGRKKNISALVYAGVDIASLANNHAQDFGQEGLEQTESNLTQKGIKVITQGNLKSFSVRGIEVAVLGFDLVQHIVTEDKLITKIKKARNKADVVIVFFHWGKEFTSKPTENQRQFAHLSIQNGADLVVGSGPHWAQAIEIYQNRLIVYSHGNTVFGGKFSHVVELWKDESREGIIGKYIFKKNKLVDVELIPIWINEQYQPEIADYSHSEKIFSRILQASEEISKNL